MRRLLALVAAAAVGGCGVMLDLAYLIDDGKYTKYDQQRRPTGETKVTLERDVVVGADMKTLGVVCEERTRSIDRAWQVQKTYQLRGGYQYAHWAPIIIEGAVGGGLALGLGLSCGEPDKIECSSLWWLTPLGVDMAYSVVRLLMIKKPKLIDKQYGEPYQSESEPIDRKPQACDGTTLLVGRSLEDPLATRVTVAPDGTIDAAGQTVALQAYASDAGMRLFTVGPDGQGLAANLNRCAFLRAHPAELSQQWSAVMQQCPPPQEQQQQAR